MEEMPSEFGVAIRTIMNYNYGYKYYSEWYILLGTIAICVCTVVVGRILKLNGIQGRDPFA